MRKIPSPGKIAILYLRVFQIGYDDEKNYKQWDITTIVLKIVSKYKCLFE